MSAPRFFVAASAAQICVSVIGMAACGKSAVGRSLARYLGWAHADTDHLIEASYATHLQNIVSRLPREEFLQIEDKIIRSLRFRRTIISTGGSVVYSDGAMEHLRTLGPVVHLDVPLPVILARIARKPERGLVILPGQSVEELFAEREALYAKWRTHRLFSNGSSCPEEVARDMADLLKLSQGQDAPL